MSDDTPTAAVHRFGVRHHGPGCARSLMAAFATLRPDCVLIEGAPEADALVAAVAEPDMRPPVALLTYAVDEPGRAVYHPFAEFSPEWQALRWAVAAGVPARFIDLPVAHGLALRDVEEAPAPARRRADPLDWLARAAGHADGEAWWNHLVEERGDGEDLFAAIEEAMLALRAEAEADPDAAPGAEEARIEALREAHMRQCVRAARKEGFQRIAVVCGAWHLAGLRAEVSAKADQALLKGLPKRKVTSTWVPWTHRHLARESGYGAGIASPGWYEHLWRCGEPGDGGARPSRAVGWLARVARLMRERDLDCSSAHLIEAARLADTLAALRQRPAPGLEELHEAVRTVMTLGDESVLAFLREELLIGDRLGGVPAGVPVVPLQRDLEQAQRALRLKPEATRRTLDLDLRQPNDLARSHLLHRLALLDLPWGELAQVGRSSRGTFHEVWTLQWEPDFALRLIEASRWGQTVADAAVARVAERCAEERSLPALAALVDRVLLAALPAAVDIASAALRDHAAVTGDVEQLLGALPPLANVFRYGNVRGTAAAAVGLVFDGVATRAAIGLPLAGASPDDGAADTLRERLLAAHAALRLRDPGRQGEPARQWRQALSQLADRDGAHAMLRGLCTRLLLDDGHIDAARAGASLSLHLSTGAEPARAAAWLDGFLNRNAVVLLHDDGVWPLVDAWLSGLSDEHFTRVLPLVRRSFARFDPGERRDLGARAARGGHRAASGPAAAAPVAWDEARAALPLPLLRRLLGVTA